MHFSSYSNENQTRDYLTDKVNDCVVLSEFNLTHVMMPSKKKKKKVVECLLGEFKIPFEDFLGTRAPNQPNQHST